MIIRTLARRQLHEFVRRRAIFSSSRPFEGRQKNPDDHPPAVVEPGENDCCGNGCQDCVWTVYWDALAERDGATRQLTAFERLEARLERESALRDKQAQSLAKVGKTKEAR